MARVDWIDQRLLNWARWKLIGGRGGLGYAGVDLTKLADVDTGRDGYVTATIPIVDCEASETDAAVQRLASELRATVEVMYLGKGTMREKAAQLFCTEATIKKRVWQSHRQLAEHFAAKADRARAERERLARLVEMSRPSKPDVDAA